MTERKFMKDSIKREPVMKLEKQAKILKKKVRKIELVSNEECQCILVED